MRSKKKNKKQLTIVVLLIVACVGVFGLMNSQKASVEKLNKKMSAEQAAALAKIQAEQEAKIALQVALQEEKTSAVSSKTDIKIGDVITVDKIEVNEFKKSELPPSYFNSNSFVIGKIASQNIFAGKIITNEDLMAIDPNMTNIPIGMRAITLPSASIQGLASYIHVGSRIDILLVKSPPEYIAQNVKIISFEVEPDVQAAIDAQNQTGSKTSASQTPAGPAQPTAPANSTQPVSPGSPVAVPGAEQPVGQTTAAITSSSNVGIKTVSSDKAGAITVLVPANVAAKLIAATLAGKLQIITRGRNDDKIIRHSSYNVSKNPSSISSVLPPPPSGTGKLPSLPGAANSVTNIVEKPKIEVEIIEANSKRQVSFDDEYNNRSAASSKDLKDLLKMPN